MQLEPKNGYVFIIDYGFFLEQMINFIIQDGGIVDKKEQKKAESLLKYYFGVSLTNFKLNFSTHILMKNLFGLVYGITNYKNSRLKENIFYPLYYKNSYGNIYQINGVFFKKIIIVKSFSDALAEAENLMKKLEEMSVNFTYTKSDDAPATTLFKFEKEVQV